MQNSPLSANPSNTSEFDDHVTPNDTHFSSQWHLNNFDGFDLNLINVWEDYSGEGISITIFDQGVDHDHPDLSLNYDVANQLSTVTGLPEGSPQTDTDNHGTAVAGLIAAANNGIGVVGVAYDAGIVSIYDPLSGTTSEFADRIALGYQHAAEFHVSNHSWGYGNAFFQSANAAFIDNFKNPVFSGAASNLEKAMALGRGGLGTVFVQSAGNARDFGDNVNLHNFQNSIYTITVSAIEQEGSIAGYSSPGAAILISAPGSPMEGSIVTTDRPGPEGYSSGDYTSTFNGTSAAAPLVSGVIALMLQANPDLGWRDVQEILVCSARNSDPTSLSWQENGATHWNGGGISMSHDFGAGLIDAYAAVRLAETWQTQNTSENLLVVSSKATPSMPVPDGKSSGISDTIHISSDLIIDHVEVDLDVNHSWIGDLSVVLTSPHGTRSVLMDRPGVGDFNGYGSSQHDIDFTFSSTQHWGESGIGTWTLSINDAEIHDSGTLDQWTLRLYGDPISEDDTYIYTHEFASLGQDEGRNLLHDAEGTDAINAAAVTSGLHIDLRPGSENSIADTGLFIDQDTFIENVFGGDGDDSIIGNLEDNALFGGRGDDHINGVVGNDVLTGGEGNDFLNGWAGLDSLYGGAGDDVIRGGMEDDLLWGDSGDDDLRETHEAHVIEGNDILHGGHGDDRLFGNEGFDTMSGGYGNDLLYAGEGDDVLDGGHDNDILEGGAGNDLFLFTMDSGMDTILDFSPGQDLIDLTPFGLDDVNALFESSHQEGDNLLIDLFPLTGDQLILADLTVDDLGSNDFLV